MSVTRQAAGKNTNLNILKNTPQYLDFPFHAAEFALTEQRNEGNSGKPEKGQRFVQPPVTYKLLSKLFMQCCFSVCCHF